MCWRRSERPTLREDHGSKGNAARREANDLRRIQNHRRSMKLGWIRCGVTRNIEPGQKEMSKEMNRVTHFEIYTDDPKAVQPFYEYVFGWKFNKLEGGPIEYGLVTN